MQNHPKSNAKAHRSRVGQEPAPAAPAVAAAAVLPAVAAAPQAAAAAAAARTPQEVGQSAANVIASLRAMGIT